MFLGVILKYLIFLSRLPLLGRADGWNPLVSNSMVLITAVSIIEFYVLILA